MQVGIEVRIEVRIRRQDWTISPRAIARRFIHPLAPNPIPCFHLKRETLMTAFPSEFSIRACASAQVYRSVRRSRMWGPAFGQRNRIGGREWPRLF